MRHVSVFALCAVVATALTAVSRADAQPTLTVSAQNVAPGTTVMATVTGTAGQSYALLGSTVDSGLSFAGQPFAVGADFLVIAVGTLDGMGQALVPVTPPFRGSTLDRYYVQAAVSPSPGFSPFTLTPGVVLRNNDLVAGLVGPAGPAGPQGPPGPAGPQGPAGPPATGSVIAQAYGGAVLPATLPDSLSYGWIQPSSLVTVTVGAGQTVMMWATVGLGTSSGATLERLTMCSQPVGGGPKSDHDSDYLFIVRMPANSRFPLSFTRRATGLAPGSYQIGVCYVTQAGQGAAWNDNDYITVHAMVVQ